MKSAMVLLATLMMPALGCANVPYQKPAGQIPGTSFPGTQPGSTIPSARGSAAQSATREICRGSPFPRGWVAVDYIGSPACSNSLHDGGANTALIVRYTTLAPETVLVVCSDQHVPNKWIRQPEESTDASSTQCPRRPGDTRAGPTIMRIRLTPR